jgi:malonyl-CoA decarboxylase
MTRGPRIAFFEALAARFGPDHLRLEAAVEAWRSNPSDATAVELHAAAEPRRQELLRRLNLAPGGTAALVHMREQLLDAMDHREDLAAVDNDFVHMFSSWFNRGFLVLQRIDWSSPASILEKIIRYEAVHRIRGWDDLRRRIDPPDRRCYAFFHPALVDEPLIFVEVALTREIPSAIAPILTVQRDVIGAEKATTAAFYSISNCQRGLTGVSFGHFLIKQVVEEIAREYASLSNFVTLSPAPGFASWLKRERAAADSRVLTADDRVALANVDIPGWWQTPKTREPVQEALLRAAAWYFLHARSKSGYPIDPVARFHLGNGARLERLNWLGDGSERAIEQAHGLMVNYLYVLEDIEKNHEAYAQQRTVVASNAVTKLARAAARDVAPANG